MEAVIYCGQLNWLDVVGSCGSMPDASAFAEATADKRCRMLVKC